MERDRYVFLLFIPGQAGSDSLIDILIDTLSALLFVQLWLFDLNFFISGLEFVCHDVQHSICKTTRPRLTHLDAQRPMRYLSNRRSYSTLSSEVVFL
jgi:hypothetical protein